MKHSFNRILFVLTMLISFAIPAASEGISPEGWSPPASYDDIDIVIGNPDAPVTIYEYASLTCPHCKNFHENIWPTVKAKWVDTGKVKLVYRHYPLDSSALAASMTIQCLPEDRRVDALSLMFGSVDRWSQSSDEFISIIQEAFGDNYTINEGQDLMSDLQKCISREGFDKDVLAPSFDAYHNDVRSTPYFIVDGNRYPGVQSALDMDKIIEESLLSKKGL